MDYGKMSIIVATLLVTGLIAYVVSYVQSLKKQKKHLVELLPEIIMALKTFSDLCNYERYFDEFKHQAFKNNYKDLHRKIKGFRSLSHRSEQQRVAIEFKQVYEDSASQRSSYNEDFIERELYKYRSFFSTLDNNPLSDEQIRSIVADEVNNLVLAGAGTGKTTTIAGKVAYILKRSLASPDEILVVSFTNAAVNEMSARIASYCHGLGDTSRIKLKTFNGFGYEITRRILRNVNLQTAFSNEEELLRFIRDRFDELFLGNEDFQRKATNFLAFFSRPQKDEKDFKNKAEYEAHERNYKNKSLDGKILKSKEEVEIANFLFLHGISYEYEKLYVLKEEDGNYDYGAYKPDFYLPDYDIWIEHFGIDRAGNVSNRYQDKPGLTASDRYKQAMLWKREIHSRYQTTLVETYSFENSEGILISSLKTKLKKRGVKFEKLEPEQVLKLLKTPEIFDGFLKLISSFLNLLKSNNILPDQVLADHRSDRRLKVFIEVFREIYKAYEEYLLNSESLDFNDMINKATEGIRSGLYHGGFKYILVDEFQDMSLGRYKFLAALKEQNPDTKLYCVGDDWQSIFRFAGSDISIITQFEKHFGYTRKSEVLKTYRFNKEILRASTEFITKNKAQLKKQLVSSFEAQEPSFQFRPMVFHTPYLNQRRAKVRDEIRDILNTIRNQTDQEQKVFIIGRYRSSNPNLPQRLGNLDIYFYTAHSSKGLTCDVSILVDMNSGTQGFPSEVVDDPILEYLLHEGDRFENAEERRLFYVAITRAKHKNYLLFDVENESKFVKELREM